MPILFKISGLLLAGAGALVVENNPGEIRNNICSWDFVAPCADWFDSAAVNQIVFLCLVAVSGLFFLSLIVPLLAKNYKQTVTEIAQFAPQKKPQAEAGVPLPASGPLATNAYPNRMPMIDFLTKAQGSGWQIIGPKSQINEFAAAIKQAGHDGILVFSGRPAHRYSTNETIRLVTLRPIPANHWDEYRFDWDSAINKHPLTGAIEGINTDNFLTLSSKWNHEKGYVDLHVEKQGALAWLVGAKSESIALSEAVIDAWERIRKLPEFDTQPSHSPEFASLRDYYEREPAKLPGIAAQIIFNSADPPLPIEGIAPPRTAMEVIPQDTARGYAFSDDATEMFDMFDREKPAQQRRRYTNLRIKRTDIERRVRTIEEDNGKR